MSEEPALFKSVSELKVGDHILVHSAILALEITTKCSDRERTSSFPAEVKDINANGLVVWPFADQKTVAPVGDYADREVPIKLTGSDWQKEVGIPNTHVRSNARERLEQERTATTAGGNVRWDSR